MINTSGASSIHFVSETTISGPGALLKQGEGALYLDGANTYTGGTTISEGTVVVNHATNGIIDTFGSGEISLAGGRLHSTTDGAITNDLSVASGSTSTVSAGPGTTLRLGDASGSSTLGLAGNLVVGATGTNGTVIWDKLFGSIYGGATLSVASGTLKASAGSSLGSFTSSVSATRVGSNAVLDLTETGGSILNLQDLSPGSGGTVAWSGNLAISGGNFSGNLDGQTNRGVAASLLKTGSDTLVLSGNNHLTGFTTISGGVLRAGSSTGLAGHIPYTVNGGTLDLNGYDLAMSYFSGSGGSVTLGSADLTVDQSATTTFAGTIAGSGSLIKTGTGTLTLTLTLTGNNFYTGGTEISGGTLAVHQGSVIDALGTGLITLNGGRLHSALGSSTLNSYLVAAGTTGTITTATGTSLWLNGGSGQSFSLQGDLVIGTNDATGDVIMDVIGTNAAPASTITVAYGRLVDGNGSLGSLTGFAGATRIASGAALDFAAQGGTIRNLQDAAPGNAGTVKWSGNLNVYGGSFSGQFDTSQGGALVKGSTDTLLLNGDNYNFRGTTSVADGKLIVGDANNSSAVLGGTINVLSGATLGGYGSVGETTVQSGGLLSPGNSIGILTVDGNLTLAPGSTLEVEIAANGASNRRSDIVGVTGTATISGSTVSVTAIDPQTSYKSAQNYTILHADGGVSGTFDTIVSKSAFLDLNTIYAANDVFLNVAIKQDPVVPVDPETPTPGLPAGPGTPEPEKPSPALFSTVAQTRNQLATAGGLDTLAQTGSSLALYNSLLMLSADEARAAFDSLSGEAYASAKGVLINDSQFIRNAAIGRLQQAFGGAPATPINALSYAGTQRHGSASASAIDAVAPATIASAHNLYAAWGNAFGAWTRQDSNSNAGSVKSSIGGFVTGIDGAVLDTWRLGLLAGYSHSSFDVDDRASSGSSDNYTLGAYAGTEWTLNNGHALAFRSGLAYTWHDIDMNRSVAFPGFADNLTSDYDAGSFQLFGELGYKIHYGKALFEPYAGLAYLRLKTDGFNEKGQTAAALAVQSDTTETSFSTLGLRASTEFALGSITATARTDLGWRHAYGDITPVSTASFIGSDAFTVSGLPIAEDAALIETGLDFKLTDDATLGLSYNGQFASGAKQNGFNAKLSVSF
ncbi:outer membrane autotransporter protein [Ochrobactrum sp. P6BSIII]|uniref:autotransporter domain-containing protein n=1 Tax=unclassified Ochrobactrum TaxID=239106 RepID=UPI001590EB72|nr:outer membrane autotransporter protein [Ochrobactrum sp. P6BSIII]